eukprot:CAMPEP_0115614694 /NCGR_PEP_ID=MMETSP0272-20121206/22240_1 /TAXON_ID=71861 /ORGANISM="Scrippsiella trochoidea, Strain CCMP3099" /LENGTH=733 /DNA_ID=CAMNT_0003050585 /DNA_START=61 /DNA_END=2264 /DNA_ORIENTATION=-
MGGGRRPARGRGFRRQEAVSSAAPQQMAFIMAPVGFVMQSPSPQSTVTLNGIDAPELYRAIDSLYADELKPYGRIVRKRLGEMARAAGHRPSDLGLKQLKVLCEAYQWLAVQNEDGGDWSALLRGRAPTFVDVHSPVDVYSAALWRDAEAYFTSLDAKSALPGGRYACAQVLICRQLPFLAGRSLGEVCHIVQLAISEKKLLGYKSGNIVAYACSQSKAKEVCAERQKPFAALVGDGCTVATWATVQACLQVLISTLPDGSDAIPLSNVKRLFRTRFQVDLSETALGYAKLSELLQDQRLKHLCSVELQEQGYIVVPKSRRLAAVLSSTSASPPPELSPAAVTPSPPAAEAVVATHEASQLRLVDCLAAASRDASGTGGSASGRDGGEQGGARRRLRDRARGVKPLLLPEDMSPEASPKAKAATAAVAAMPAETAAASAPPGLAAALLDASLQPLVSPEHEGTAFPIFPPTPHPLSPYFAQAPLTPPPALPRLLGSALNRPPQQRPTSFFTQPVVAAADSAFRRSQQEQTASKLSHDKGRLTAAFLHGGVMPEGADLAAAHLLSNPALTPSAHGVVSVGGKQDACSTMEALAGPPSERCCRSELRVEDIFQPDDSGSPDRGGGPPATCRPLPEDPLTPNMLENLGFRVQNTFINTSVPPLLVSPCGARGPGGLLPVPRDGHCPGSGGFEGMGFMTGASRASAAKALTPATTACQEAVLAELAGELCKCSMFHI